jgi:hypothetical protein
VQVAAFMSVQRPRPKHSKVVVTYDEDARKYVVHPPRPGSCVKSIVYIVVVPGSS